jgi:hypothetical protein
MPSALLFFPQNPAKPVTFGAGCGIFIKSLSKNYPGTPDSGTGPETAAKRQPEGSA